MARARVEVALQEAEGEAASLRRMVHTHEGTILLLEQAQ